MRVMLPMEKMTMMEMLPTEKMACMNQMNRVSKIADLEMMYIYSQFVLMDDANMSSPCR
jgi:hypothetical protein